jgi:predicted RNA-binding Zn ribbon-like protein
MVTMQPVRTVTDTERSGAPGDLELVRRLINTHDVETGAEELSSPEALSAWLAEHELGPAGAALAPTDLERVIELREALRQVLLANNGQELPGDTYERLNEAVAGATLAVRFDDECTVGLVPSGAGVDAAVARVAAIVREAILAGEWARMKVCPADDCHWAFYDRSRNHSRTWCDMADCGNRAKVKAFRERHAH